MVDVEGWFSDIDDPDGDRDDADLAQDPAGGYIVPDGVISQPSTASYVQTVISGPDSSGVEQVRLENGTLLSMLPSQVTHAQQLHTQNGTLYPAQGDSTESTPDGPGGVSQGPCGSSFVNLVNRDNGGPVQMITAFYTNRGAVEYNWAVGISGPSYNYLYKSSGGLLSRHDWKGHHASHKAYPHGSYIAGVVWGSWAMLNNRAICFSGGPTVHQHL